MGSNLLEKKAHGGWNCGKNNYQDNPIKKKMKNKSTKANFQ